MMNTLLTQLQTRETSEIGHKEDLLVANTETGAPRPQKQDFSIQNPDDALEALKSKPDTRLLVEALRRLVTETGQSNDFNIKKPGPKTTQIIFVLVNDIIPDYWSILNANGFSKHIKEKRLLTRCLSSVAGIGAIISRLRLLLGQLKDPQSQAKISVASKSQPIDDLLDVLEKVFVGEKFTASVWSEINAFTEKPSQRSLQWKEFLSMVASGRVLSIASEAASVSKDLKPSLEDGSWVGNGSRYAQWLGANIQHMNFDLAEKDEEGRKATSQLLSKALNLGYTDHVVRALFSDLIGGNGSSLDAQKTLMSRLSALEQKTLVYALIRVLDFPFVGETIPSAGSKALAGTAALLSALVDRNPILQNALIEWLVGVSTNIAGQSRVIYRAVIAALSRNNGQVLKALQRSLESFGDKLYIKHTPILLQEINTQILLILAGYVFRANKTELVNISRSSIYLNAISNRLSTSSPRARFLGMVVGTAFSELVDPEDKRMNFGADELSSPDGLWYRTLTAVNDAVGSIKDLKPIPTSTTRPITKAGRSVERNRKSTKLTVPAVATSRIISTEEINDSSDSEEEDLPAYEKPYSDPSDEDEDPTLVQRDRPTAPVYIPDLIAGLRDTENFDRHKLALVTASTLIRRKAAFGSEVSDNIEELATLLIGLSDKWEMEKFQKMRLQGMIAVLTAEPLRMAQWFSKTFYNGDYSMSQRASVLTTLGMGARELAGLAKEDAALTGANAKETTFPSKRLPDKLHKVYALETAPMNALSAQLEKSMIQPMAASAADQITGPSVLKVRTFSSRLEIEKKRQKPISNALAKVVAEGFFFPLTGRWRIHLQTYGENSSHTSPFLLSHLLKTLSLILHASGSSTLSLPQMSSEFWDLLLSLRPRATDPSVLEALLFAFLTLLDINENNQRRLAEEHAKELLETQGWVEAVFERIGGGSEQDDRIRMLAAGVLLRTREVVEKFQRTLMGDLADYM